MSSDVMRSIPWICDSHGHSPHRACPLLPIISPISSSHSISFSPRPLSPAPSCPLALNNPPPPGVGGADGRTVCDCWLGSYLLASNHTVPLTPLIARSLLPPPMP